MPQPGVYYKNSDLREIILFLKNTFQNVWNCRVAMDRRVKLTSRRQENSRTESIQGRLFPSCPSRRSSQASSGLEQLTVTCLAWATAPGRPVLEPLQPEQVAVPSPWYSFPGLGTTPLSPWPGPLSRLTLRPFRRKMQPCQTQPQGSSARGQQEHQQMKDEWVSGTDSEPAQQPTATKTQAFRLSPPKSQFRERGKKC